MGRREAMHRTANGFGAPVHERATAATFSGKALSSTTPTAVEGICNEVFVPAYTASRAA